MCQMKNRGSMARSLMAFILVTFFALAVALGQPKPNIRFHIPYEFNVGTKTLPAGAYTFTLDESVLRVQSATATDVNAMSLTHIIARLTGPSEFIRDGYLVFDKTDSKLILSEVWIPGTEGVFVSSIPKGHTRFTLAGTAMEMDRPYSGKQAYSLTCAKCHGENGKGDANAEKFFKFKIPRLDSAEVQGKSDAELKELISKGTEVMPPVEIDEAGFRHRLPPQDVDAVIVYLRTLKQ